MVPGSEIGKGGDEEVKYREDASANISQKMQYLT